MTTANYTEQIKAGLDKVASASGISPTGEVTVTAGGDTVVLVAETGEVVQATPTVTTS